MRSLSFDEYAVLFGDKQNIGGDALSNDTLLRRCYEMNAIGSTNRPDNGQEFEIGTYRLAKQEDFKGPLQLDDNDWTLVLERAMRAKASKEATSDSSINLGRRQTGADDDALGNALLSANPAVFTGDRKRSSRTKWSPALLAVGLGGSERVAHATTSGTLQRVGHAS
ncbi:hypothetical protein FQR65_LT20336 [Abscondita terminalis]|nr:hypothetical protein FQR65_LT20336 [Abscondita terminalis]